MEPLPPHQPSTGPSRTEPTAFTDPVAAALAARLRAAPAAPAVPAVRTVDAAVAPVQPSPGVGAAALGGHAAVPRSDDLIAGFFARYAGSSLRTYQSKLASYARWLGVSLPDLPGVLLARGGPQAHLSVLAYKAHLRDERRLSPSTINGHLAAIHAVAEFLREVGLCDWVLKVRYEKARGYRDTRGPGVKALRKLVAAAGAAPDPAKAARDMAIVRLLVDLGLRRGELVALDLEHVEHDAEGQPAAVQVLGKGQADRQRLTLPPKTATALAVWLAHHPHVREEAGDHAADESSPPGDERSQVTGETGQHARATPLFTALDPGAGRLGRRGQPRERGARLTGLAVAKLLTSLARRAGLGTPVRPHGVRHTAITALLDTGLGLRDVQRFSRHADVRTLAVYDDNRTDIAGRVAVTMSELV